VGSTTAVFLGEYLGGAWQSRGRVCAGSDIVRRRAAQSAWPRARSARFNI
jgi:hypothetical protein